MSHNFSLLPGVVLLFFAANLFAVHARSLRSPNHDTDILKTLEGTEKGREFKGIEVVKNYLKSFGYLPTDSSVDDVFDELLETALRTYQEFFGLKVTGRMESETIRSMMTPRCGVPDLSSFSQTTTVNSNYAFWPGKPRWPPSRRNLSYIFNSAVDVLPIEATRSAVWSAFKTWSSVTNFTFQEAQWDRAADLLIGYFRHDHGDEQPFDGPGGILAHTFPPVMGKLHIDADEKWSTAPGPSQIDLESVVLHEVGHLLGLDHSTVPSAVMFPSIHLGQVKRQLQPDDIDGIHALYSEG